MTDMGQTSKVSPTPPLGVAGLEISPTGMGAAAGRKLAAGPGRWRRRDSRPPPG
jgi:hypothetical protein